MIATPPAELYQQALTAQQLGRHDEAAAAFAEVSALVPGIAEPHFFRAVSLQALARHAEAATAYQAAIGIRPELFEAHNNLGMTLQSLGAYVDALACHDRAVALNPNSADAHNSRGNCLVGLDCIEDAMAAFDRAIDIERTHYEAINNRAIVLHRRNRLDEARASYDRAIVVAAEKGLDFAEGRFNRGLLRLLVGDFAGGWDDYDYRLNLDGYHNVVAELRGDDGLPAVARAPGEKPLRSGKSLFVRAEQGYGDTFQFVRYLPLLKQEGYHVTFECQYGLKTLLGASGLCDAIVERPKANSLMPAPKGAVEVYVQSLPRFFKTDLTNVPSSLPYLRTPKDRSDKWATRIAELDLSRRTRIGIVWSAGLTDPANRHRSCRLADFAPLARIPGVAFFGLQKGVAETDAPPAGMPYIPLSGELEDFADTAGAIEQMDLVISIDTSVAHLAGALGKSVWTLLPWSADWRWMLDRDDSPWYPTMRLFRQPGPGEWGSMFEDVANAIQSGPPGLALGGRSQTTIKSSTTGSRRR